MRILRSAVGHKAAMIDVLLEIILSHLFHPLHVCRLGPSGPVARGAEKDSRAEKSYSKIKANVGFAFEELCSRYV